MQNPQFGRREVLSESGSPAGVTLSSLARLSRLFAASTSCQRESAALNDRSMIDATLAMEPAGTIFSARPQFAKVLISPSIACTISSRVIEGAFRTRRYPP